MNDFLSHIQDPKIECQWCTGHSKSRFICMEGEVQHLSVRTFKNVDKIVHDQNYLFYVFFTSKDTFIKGIYIE